ncbi:arylsulfatase [Croceicoccus sp. F390]|uniref:Arylsulfatase n=1 Tax=Croceicoccus esteveae TaxID=3075597 RepID=A0ABU2ZGL5_9SPHN|nr:arylsulfatase [Croceicoccus sp. F390]MDT0574562.1 arylsulfatase [Croceicoccus sp. F390]
MIQHLRAALTATALVAAIMSAPAVLSQQPNILVILVDDLGFSDIGAFGGEIQTPHLDALATGGLRLTNFHTTPVCAPTRAELLTGVDHHQTGIGNFPELIQDNQKGHPGYEGYLTKRVATIAERLQSAGYSTLMSGKWHLGYDPRANPANRGFQKSFVLLGGGHNHFGQDLPYKISIPNAGTKYTENGVVVPTPQPFYSSDTFTDRLISNLPAKAGDKPFFAYLALTAPHYPLQAPPEDIARYKGRYDAGYDALHDERLERQQALGLLKPGTVPHPRSSPVRWTALSPEQKAVEARLMEVYAAMVDRVDQNIGRLVQTLKQRGLYENTIIVFLSDNGAEGHRLDESVIAAEQGKRILASADNRLESIGTAKSYIWYGSNWAEAATVPSRLYKSFPTEGGTRVTAFISGPERVRTGISNTYMSVRDVVPTLLDYAGVPSGTEVSGQTVLAPQGRSVRDWLIPGSSDPANDVVVANGEMFGRLYARHGRWKAVMIPPPTGPGTWQLYDVVADPGEINDKAASNPEELAKLKAQWQAYADRTGVVSPQIPGN